MNIVDQKPFPLPAFEDRLWDELERHYAEAWPAPRSSDTGRRRRGWYLAAVGGIAAAAAVVAGVIVVGHDGAKPADVASPVGQRPADAIVVATSVDADGTHIATRWEDEATGSYRLAQYGDDGKVAWEEAGRSLRLPAGETGPEVVGGANGFVSHSARKYAESAPFQPPDGRTDGVGPREDVVVADAIDSGLLKADGTETVDGTKLDRYVSSAQGDVRQVVWLDPTTRRPVATELSADSSPVTRTTFEYLPRTAQNLALVRLGVPGDYEQVDQLPNPASEACGDEEPGSAEAALCQVQRLADLQASLESIKAELAGKVRDSVDSHS